jgi:DnaK suppressor protein
MIMKKATLKSAKKAAPVLAKMATKVPVPVKLKSKLSTPASKPLKTAKISKTTQPVLNHKTRPAVNGKKGPLMLVQNSVSSKGRKPQQRGEMVGDAVKGVPMRSMMPLHSGYTPPTTAPVPTDGKPRKNQAGFMSKELEHFRDLLLEKRREIVGDMSSMEREALRSATGSNLSNLPVHMADMGTDNYEQEFTLGLVEKDRQLLRDINRALAKIQDGSYGICEGTGKPIGKPRLEAQPWAKYSIEYARQLETNLMIRR